MDNVYSGMHVFIFPSSQKLLSTSATTKAIGKRPKFTRIVPITQPSPDWSRLQFHNFYAPMQSRPQFVKSSPTSPSFHIYVESHIANEVTAFKVWSSFVINFSTLCSKWSQLLNPINTNQPLLEHDHPTFLSLLQSCSEAEPPKHQISKTLNCSAGREATKTTDDVMPASQCFFFPSGVTESSVSVGQCHEGRRRAVSCEALITLGESYCGDVCMAKNGRLTWPAMGPGRACRSRLILDYMAFSLLRLN